MKCNATIFGVAMVLLAVVLMPAASARAEYVTGFESAEGYTLNSEIGGVNGWQVISGNSAHATIRNNLVNSGAQALRLSDTSALSNLKLRVGCHVHACVDMPKTSINMPTLAWAWHPNF